MASSRLAVVVRRFNLQSVCQLQGAYRVQKVHFFAALCRIVQDVSPLKSIMKTVYSDLPRLKSGVRIPFPAPSFLLVAAENLPVSGKSGNNLAVHVKSPTLRVFGPHVYSPHTTPSRSDIGEVSFSQSVARNKKEGHGICLSKYPVERDERLVFSLSVCGQRVTHSSPPILREREMNPWQHQASLPGAHPPM